MLARILLLSSITFLFYSPVLKNDFVTWDDEQHILNNADVQRFDAAALKHIFTSDVNKTYIPLTILTFAVEHHFWGNNPFVYHVDNLLLHIIVVILIFIFALEMGLKSPAALWAAGLFALHPMHAEAVAWATARKDVLYSVFFMGSLLNYVRYLKTERKDFFVLANILGILSMLAKPMALSLPLVLLLCDWFYGRKLNRNTFAEKIPLFIVISLLGWLTYSLNIHKALLTFNGLFLWCRTFVFYLEKFLFPFIFMPIYPLPGPLTLIASPLILALILCFLFLKRKSKWIVFAFGFYVCSIFFLLRFNSDFDTTFVADRYMYLPSLGFCLLFGWGAEKVLEGNVFKKTFMAFLLMSLFLSLGVKTFAQTKIWQNGITLWEYQLSIFSNTAVAYTNLATAYSHQDNYKKAVLRYRDGKNLDNEEAGLIRRVIDLYKQAILLDPTYIYAVSDLKCVYKDLGFDKLP